MLNSAVQEQLFWLLWSYKIWIWIQIDYSYHFYFKQYFEQYFNSFLAP